MTSLLNELEHTLVERADDIEDLLAYHRNQVHCPVYTSVDIRRNRHKMAVVDANAFPAGFNNLAARSHKAASEAMDSYIHKMYSGVRKILLLAENHTRNAWYFENLYVLGQLFEKAGFEVTYGTLAPELFPKTEIESALGNKFTIHGVSREGDCLVANGDIQDLVVLNNDLSSGAPDLLDNLDQPITPPPAMGWHRRLKSEHFLLVRQLAEQMGEHAGFDPWLMTSLFETAKGVDFKAREGLEEVAGHVDSVLAKVQAKYDEYGIDKEPSVFVKADAGTYGMGIMTATSGDEFLNLNSKQREKMDKGKEKVKTTSLIIQEGVPTSIRDADRIAEPVMYMVCGKVVGGFNRVHGKKSETENLNSPGSSFNPLAFATQLEGEPGADEATLSRVDAHLYQIIGEVASIATGYELRAARELDFEMPRY